MVWSALIGHRFAIIVTKQPYHTDQFSVITTVLLLLHIPSRTCKPFSRKELNLIVSVNYNLLQGRYVLSAYTM